MQSELQRRLLVFCLPFLPSSIDVSSFTLKSFLFVMTSSTFRGPCCVTQGVSFAVMRVSERAQTDVPMLIVRVGAVISHIPDRLCLKTTSWEQMLLHPFRVSELQTS